MANNIVVVGYDRSASLGSLRFIADIQSRGGVSGLTCALLLAKSKANTVTVVAKHMPGDYDIEYASPIAGANVVPCVPSSESKTFN